MHFLHVKIKESGKVFGVLLRRLTEEGEVYDLCDKDGRFLKTILATEADHINHSSKE